MDTTDATTNDDLKPENEQPAAAPAPAVAPVPVEPAPQPDRIALLLDRFEEFRGQLVKMLVAHTEEIKEHFTDHLVAIDGRIKEFLSAQ